jgi:TatD DNase family protein
VLVDSHCHLDPQYFAGGSDAVIDRAREAGVGGFVCVGVGSAAAARFAVELAGRRDDVVATVGVHPHDAASVTPELMAELEPLLRDAAVSAVGEVGLDYHYDHSPRDVQRRVFADFIALAKQLRKPLVIHTRSAAADTIELLQSEGARDVGGVIHCFSEDRPFAEQALDLGFDVSFSGIVTFKSARSVQEVAEWAPLDRIMVETDSPYLAPVPLRGKPCEPAYVVHTARRVAELRGLGFEELARASTENAARRFGAKLAVAARRLQTEER